MFKFKLASVLSLKEKIEDSKKRELGFATMEKERVQSEKKSLEQEKHQLIEDTKVKDQESVDVAKLRLYHHYSARLDKAIDSKQVELSEAKEKLEEKRVALLEAVKERKILENLKAIEKEAFDEEARREEQRITDDMVTYKYGIKGKE